jgi:hypothetical protein
MGLSLVIHRRDYRGGSRGRDYRGGSRGRDYRGVSRGPGYEVVCSELVSAVSPGRAVSLVTTA